MSEAPAFSTSDDGVQTAPSVAERSAAPHLAALGEKARDYARNARSENTQRAYDADWRQFSSWLRRQGFDALPPNPRTVGLYLAACVDGGRGKEPPPSRRWSGASLGFAGAIASSANRWTRAIGTSRPCSPGSGASMADRPSKKKRSSPTTCARCWRRSTTI